MKKNIELTVDEFTSPCPEVVTPSTSVKEIMWMMEMKGVRHIPVVEDGQATGIISDRDIRLMAHVENIEKLTAADIMSDTPYAVTSNTPLEEVAYEMSDKKIGSAIVNGLDGKIEGIFTSTDALNALVEVLRGEL